MQAISVAHDLLKDPATRAGFDAAKSPPRGQTVRRANTTATSPGPPDNPYRHLRGFGSPFAGQSDPGDLFAEILRQLGGDARGFRIRTSPLRALTGTTGLRCHLSCGPWGRVAAVPW